MTRRILKSVGRAMLAGAAVFLAADPATLTTSADILTIASPAQAADMRISFFFNHLEQHGTWVAYPRYGFVFVPAVGAGWRPYVDGHWVYTDQYGWYWESDEPFSWAVYHYGRWGYDPAYGWFWIPGNVWAPAWVTWRYGGGHVGWAPIGPYGDGYVYGTPDYYEPPIVEAWVFVPEHRFATVNVARFVTPVVQINLFLGKARERHHTSYREGRAYNPFLPRNRARQIVKQEIKVYNITNVNDPDKASTAARKDGKNSIRSFQVDIADAQPKETPRKVAKSPDEVKSKPRLKQTAKGVKPDDAPPSAAELKPGSPEVQEGETRKKGRAANHPDETVKPGTPDAQGQKVPADQGGQATAVPGPDADGTRLPAAATEQKQPRQQVSPPQGPAPRQEQLQQKQVEPPPQPPAPAAGQDRPAKPPKAQAPKAVSPAPAGVPPQASGRTGKGGPAGPQTAPPDAQLPAAPQAPAGQPRQVQVPQPATPDPAGPAPQSSHGGGKGRDGPQGAAPGGGKEKNKPE